VPRVGEEEPEVSRAGGRDVAQPVADEEEVAALQDELVDAGRLRLLRGVGVAEELRGVGEPRRPSGRIPRVIWRSVTPPA
jgi:hypothetical protein